MPTTGNFSIGSTSADYPDIATWEGETDDTLTGIVRGLLQDEEFPENGITILGAVTTASLYRELMADDGSYGEAGSDQSFIAYKDDAGFKLRCDLTRGASITSNVTYGVVILSTVENYVRLRRLQIKHTGTSYAKGLQFYSTDGLASQIIISMVDGYNRVGFTGSSYGDQNQTNENILITYSENGDTMGNTSTAYQGCRYGGKGYYITAVNCSGSGTGTKGVELLTDSYPGTLKNVASLNFVTDFSKSGTATHTINYCASVDATADDYGGTGHLVSLTWPTDLDFESDGDGAEGDFRIQSTSSLYQAGDPISGVTVDILDNVRDVTSPCIGCFELVVAGGLSIPVAMDQYARLRQ